MLFEHHVGMENMFNNQGGYPRRGLSSVSLPMHWRQGVSGERLREKLERWEHKRGNTMFEAKNLEKLPTPLAYEMSNVWVSLREKFPEVRAASVNFHNNKEKGVLADATSYAELYPRLRATAQWQGSQSPVDTWNLCDDDSIDDEEFYALAKELLDAKQFGDTNVDVTATGAIELSACLSHPRCHKKLLAYWDKRNERARVLGVAPRIVPLGTSVATYVLAHEFGHLVDSALAEHGALATERVYAALSRGVLGGSRPRKEQWRNNLWNYPTGYLKANSGWYEGSAERGRDTVRSLRPVIGAKLGSYATVNRDELFAESFSLSYCASDAELLRDLSLLKDALVKEGIGVARRR